MPDYRAPLEDMQFVLNEIAGMDAVRELPGCEEATEDMVTAILEEAAKLAAEVLAPLNAVGDRQGARLDAQGRVAVADGFSEAYRQYVDGGWGSLQFPQQWGGQGLPTLLSAPIQEMWQAANLSWGLCPLLTQGAIETLYLNGSETLQQQYIPQLVSGQWAGTMNLTEPQAGSDLAAIKTRAVPERDHYLLYGQKIFITWGEHEMAENIIHMVLARLPDAPEGVKGLSMFLVPKYLPDAEGKPGQRNDLRAVSLEHKMGIHGSPTCMMSYGDNEGAVGYLVGPPHQGIACMFTMMNSARLAVGMQGISLCERAYQQAVAYARERVQGQAPAGGHAVTIIHHPDVRRMLMLMRAFTEAGRALAYTAYGCLDHQQRAAKSEAREAGERVALLTPIIKGWCTEVAQEVTNLGLQVHGGMGFIEETGAAQLVRDARILTIYEGTNGIQALDLVGRKLLLDQGEAFHNLLDEMQQTVNTCREPKTVDPVLQSLIDGSDEAIAGLRQAGDYLLKSAGRDANLAGSAAFNFMMLAGTVCGGWQMLLAAQKVQAAEHLSPEFIARKKALAVFYGDHILPRYQGYLAAIMCGSDAVMALEESAF